MGPGFCFTVEVLEIWVTHCVAVHSTLKSTQYLSKLCFRVPLGLQGIGRLGWGVASSLEGLVYGVGFRGSLLTANSLLAG